MAKKDVVMKSSQDIDLYEGMSLDSNEGFENVTGSDFVLPLIKVVQRTSNKIFDQNPDATPGQIFNSVNGELYDGSEGLLVSLCFFEVMYVEMIPLDQGGGLVDFHKTLANLDVKMESGKWITKHDTYIIQSNYHFVRVWEPEQFDGIVILSSTQLKQSRLWMSMAKSLRMPNLPTQPLPLYHGMYRLTTRDEVKKTFKYKGWNVKFDRHPTQVELVEAKNLYETIKASKLNERRPFATEEIKEDLQSSIVIDSDIEM